MNNIMFFYRIKKQVLYNNTLYQLILNLSESLESSFIIDV